MRVCFNKLSRPTSNFTLLRAFASSKSRSSTGCRKSTSAASAAPSPVASFPSEFLALNRAFDAHVQKEPDRPVFVNDLGVVERQYKRWVKNLPNVRPFYAVKCNPDETLLKALADLGTGFDCASQEEIASALKLGVHAEDIIFANPIKSVTDLRYAAKVGVKKMTFDNEDELRKIKQYHPEAEVVIRLLPDDSGSLMRFGSKFGAAYESVESLLRVASSLQLKVIGTSFHIGSGCFNANNYESAIALCRHVFDMAEKMGMPKLNFLDLGGGFPGNPVENEPTGRIPAFETFASVIRQSLTKHFSSAEFPELQIIGEPGRYMATAWSTLFALVQGKRTVHQLDANEKRKFLYYINDGVYGSFNSIMFDHAHPYPFPAHKFFAEHVAQKEAEHHKSLIRPDVLAMDFESNPYAIYSLVDMLSTGSGFSGRRINTVPFHVMSKMPADRAYAFSAPFCSQARRNMFSQSTKAETSLATIFGPTCDSMDVLGKDMEMEELFVGDWLAFANMGAYTSAAASTFNGMPRPIIRYCYSSSQSPFMAELNQVLANHNPEL